MDGATPTPGSLAAGSSRPEALQHDIIVEESLGVPPIDAPIADAPPRKQKARRRLLRGLSRTSSSTSLSGRARSSSTPYSRSGASLSCMSLSESSSPFASSSSSSSHAIAAGLNIPPGSAGSSQSLSPSASTTPFPAFPHPFEKSQTSNAIRKVDLATLPTDLVRVASMPLFPPRPRRTFIQLWDALPHEVKIRILGFLIPVELVRLSGTNRSFQTLCFDGQLWSSFDTSTFYSQIPLVSLANILSNAGPFLKHLNLRGCRQLEKLEGAMTMAIQCNNLVSATLEGSCISSENIDELLRRNRRLAHINLAGLSSVHSSSCLAIAARCTQLEVLNLSWCKNVMAVDACTILEACPKLRDLRLSEMPGFGDQAVAQRFFAVNRLERLVLSGCMELSDQSLAVMMHGIDPPRDILSRKPLTPPRALRYLDLSRCPQITDRGLQAVGHCAPYLEGLMLIGMTHVTDDGLKPVLATAQNLSVLEVENIPQLTDDLLINHVATAPCAASSLRYLSLGYCENITDDGVLPVLRACTNLTTLYLDNTSITNETLIEAARVVRSRQPASVSASANGSSPRPPHVGLTMEVYDCHNITWAGVREVMSRNTEALLPHNSSNNNNNNNNNNNSNDDDNDDDDDDNNNNNNKTSSSQIIALKCFYSWQMTVNEHVKRVLQCRLDAARRLEQKWADFMQASEEAGTDGAGLRRRRRRMRAAEQAHADEHEGEATTADAGVGNTIGRRRARTATCAVM